MSKAIQIIETGGVDVMRWVDLPLKSEGPAASEIRIKHEAIGVNYIDTYHRSGVYPVKLPCVLGLEGVGTITAIGSNVVDFRVGDRVGYASGPLGSYSQERDFRADGAFKIPDFIDSYKAAGLLLKGMTVEYLFNRTYKIKRGEHILFHAAAGGVGLIACQWAKAVGAVMIGTVSNKKKEFIAKEAGCHHVINYLEENVVERVMEITDGKGVSVAYDGVGKDTFNKTIDCLSERGLFVSFGQSSGMIEKVGLHESFAPKNLFYTRPSLLIYNKTKNDILESSSVLFDFYKNKKINIKEVKKYDLKNASVAHDDLQQRNTFGSLVLVP